MLRIAGALPLTDVRVLDLTRLLPGGFCSQLLADLGADVIKVEDTRAGDYMRLVPPYYDGEQDSVRSAPFLALNRNKRSIQLDLKQPAGRAALLALAADADVLIESFRPGVLERLGVGYEELANVNPRLVYCPISGYGAGGRDAQRSGHDINYLARAGVLAVSGDRGGSPQSSGAQIADIGGGALMAVTGILAALRERDGTSAAPGSGLGQLVDVSMFDGALAWMAVPAAHALCEGRSERRGELVLGGAAICYRAYEAADGWVSIGAIEPKFWANWCEAVDRPDLIDAQFAPPGGPEHREVCAIFARRSRAEWAEFADRVDCCLEPVLELDEALASDLVRERDLVVEIDQPGLTDTPRVVGPPIRLSRTPADPTRRPAPALGADTREVLNEASYESDMIEELIAAGAAAEAASSRAPLT